MRANQEPESPQKSKPIIVALSTSDALLLLRIMENSTVKKLPLILIINNRRHIIRHIEVYTDREFVAIYKGHRIDIELAKKFDGTEWDINCFGPDGIAAYEGYKNQADYPDIEDAIEECLRGSLLTLPKKENHASNKNQ